jgi:tetratricopeptide (TPR) repeat protein
MIIEDLFVAYKRLLSRHRYIVVATLAVYVTAIMAYLKVPVIAWFRAPAEVTELRGRVLDLETQRRQQDQILATLTATTVQSDFLKPLKFDEKWRDERARETVGRLIEYAEFAMSKNDFEHAERFYSEANEVQPTVSIPYYEGRLAYRRGNLQRAEAKWLEAIKRDPDRKYPDLRLYLGVLYYQLGRAGEAKQYLKNFGGETAPNIAIPGDLPKPR